MSFDLDIEAKITQIVEIYDKDNDETNFFMEKDGEWLLIPEEKYYELIGDNND